MDHRQRDRTGRWLTLVGVGLGVLVPAGLAALFYVGSVPPHRGLGELSFPLVWAMPAMLAALSLPSRPLLLVPATVLGFLSAVTPFLWMSLVFLVPTVLYWLVYSLRGPQPMAHNRAVAAVLVPVLAGVGAFFVLMVHPDPLCWDWSEDPSGARTYTTVRGEDCATNPGRGIDPVLVEPGTETQTRRGGTSDTVSAPEAAASAVLVAAGLLGGRALAPSAVPPLPRRSEPLVRVRAVTTTRGYGSRPRRRAVIAAVAALAWALAAAAVVLFVPLGTSVSVEAVEVVEVVEVVEGVEAVPGRSTRSSYTLLEEEGPGLLVVLAIPVVLALAGVIGAATDRARLATCAASLLVVAVLLGAASIGLFFAPAAVVALLAARWTAAGGEPDTQKAL